jgi:cyclophilin family peptidyl-prolyl cis-trans isomerase
MRYKVFITRRALREVKSSQKRWLSKIVVVVMAFSLFILTVLYVQSFLTLLVQGYNEALNRTQEMKDDPMLMADVDSNVKNTIYPKDVTLVTSVGDIVIQLRPDLSPESVQYIKALLDSTVPCKRCRFYRAEQRGILQGVLKKEGIMPNEVLGKCPDDIHDVPNCHGPLMTKGMVGWAAGEGGPDFFINNYPSVAEWWDHDHTVWGEIVDEDSFKVVDSFFDLPRHKDGLTYLDEDVPIELK